MLSSRRFRLFWARYVCPSRLERDPYFRAVLDDATTRGLHVAGMFGVAAIIAFGIARVATDVSLGSDMVSAAMRVADILTDKLRVLAVAAGFLVVARFKPRVQVGRLLVAGYVLLVAWSFLTDDLFRGTFGLTAAWFALLLLVTAGTVPFQPWQTAAIGTVMTVALSVAVWGTDDVLSSDGGLLRFVYLVLATFIATAMTGAIYGGRYAQHRVTRRLAAARRRLGERGRQLEARGAELERQRGSLETNLTRLERMQTQLVQQEKMASLGQLTAGVAHELKNPLNFVNNFAQLSAELVDDLEAELNEDPARPVGEALEESADLLADLRTNANKIREHGRRADGIIRSMLAHSRATPGPRRPARLNSLMQEYIGLAYHGMRAEHTSFNVDIQKHFDADLGEVEMVPEEMGRVFLNLLDNAFAAVRQRTAAAEEAGDTGYRPVVSVTTRSLPGGGVSVEIADNGTGMPQEVRERIFEPFFTTKPSGEGTGLGLSLAYEIVVHGHGGMLSVASEDGAGTTFTVRLPGPHEDLHADGDETPTQVASDGASGEVASPPPPPAA